MEKVLLIAILIMSGCSTDSRGLHNTYTPPDTGISKIQQPTTIDAGREDTTVPSTDTASTKPDAFVPADGSVPEAPIHDSCVGVPAGQTVIGYCSGTVAKGPIACDGNGSCVVMPLGTGGATTSTGGTSTSTGGSISFGGTTTIPGTGGRVGTGGSIPSTGGEVTTGGSISFGGTTSVGGSTPSTGGNISFGGSVPVGGASTGGNTGTGGISVTGGTTTITTPDAGTPDTVTDTLVLGPEAQPDTVTVSVDAHQPCSAFLDKCCILNGGTWGPTYCSSPGYTCDMDIAQSPTVTGHCEIACGARGQPPCRICPGTCPDVCNTNLVRDNRSGTCE